jgi:hypothetical protein
VGDGSDPDRHMTRGSKIRRVQYVTALAKDSGLTKSYSALSKSTGVPSSTLRDRDRGRISKKERAAEQQRLPLGRYTQS